MYADDRERILRNVKESVEGAGQKPEDSAYYFVIGLCIAIFAGLIVVVANIKFKNNQLAVYGQKIQTEVNEPLKSQTGNKDLAIENLSSQVEAFQVALSGRVDVGKFLSDLASNQYKNSKWTNLSLNSNKVAITMEADNFEDVSKSLKSLQNIKSVQKASLSDVNVNPGDNTIDFTVELIVDFSDYKAGKK